MNSAEAFLRGHWNDPIAVALKLPRAALRKVDVNLFVSKKFNNNFNNFPSIYYLSFLFFFFQMSFFLQPVCNVNRETLNLELPNPLLSQTLDFCFISALIYPHHRYFSAWCYIRTVTVVLPNSPAKLQLNESPVKVRVCHLTLAYAYCRCPLCMQFFFSIFFLFFFFLSFFPLFFLPLLSVITHHTITKKLFHNVCWACCFIRYVTILVFFCCGAAMAPCCTGFCFLFLRLKAPVGSGRGERADLLREGRTYARIFQSTVYSWQACFALPLSFF